MSEPTTHTAKFQVGQVIRHLRFDYRGVVADVDPTYQGSEEWYDVMARSRPPRDKPWYHVLVHGAEHTTYVAERHLAPDESGEAIQHPLVDDVFAGFEDGRYLARQRAN
ncbi:MAG: heat shock protein HspQ [Alphaproteobacteria bacterium]|jgi:heat shock protein HspQ|nr:heat shock protein HspQ [Alphaproteobacteria bacterium]